MFWIGFIVGMFVLALIAFGAFMWCMKAADVSWKNVNDLYNANVSALYNRESRIEVYCENTNEKVFEADFKYPWGDYEE
jgi:hypothetical protein